MKNSFKSFLFVFGYGFAFYALVWFLHKADIIKVLPNDENLLMWDGGWYKNIVDNGYQFFEKASNSAFYLLFPLIWRWTHLSPIGICFLNIGLFATAFAIFTSIYKLSDTDKFIWVSIPSFAVIFVPYTEALFALMTSLTFLGISKDNKPLIWISLFLLSLVRPVAMILIPAFLITELLINTRSHWYKALFNFFITYGLPLILGQTFFIWFQHYETGVWFAFFKQEKNWGHIFSWPTLPFGSMNGPKFLWLNAIGMFCGFVSLLLLIKAGIMWLFKDRLQNDRLFIVSLLYLVAIMLIAIFFNPTWVIDATNVYDVHRYATATPFFWVFLHRFLKERSYGVKDYLLIIVLSNILWLTFASYLHVQFLLYFNFATAIVLLYMYYSKKADGWPPLTIAFFNVFMQLCMFTVFIEGGPIS